MEGSMSHGVTRRQFLKASGVVGAGLALGPAALREARALEPGPVVALAKGASPATLVREAIGAAGGMGSFVRPGETVVVKPNIGWDRVPEQAANTHPDVVVEVVRMCLEAGASRVMVFDRTCNEPRRSYQTSGIAPAVEGMGDPRVELSHVDARRYRSVDVAGATSLKNCLIYEEVLRADRFINVPIAKHHSASTLTLGMKNVMGVLGGNRGALHQSIHPNLVDLNRVVRSDLTVVDATRVLVANGPQGGSLKDVQVLDTVIAGADIVAVDSVACGLFGKSARDVRYVRLAQEAGLGVADPSRIALRKVEA